MGNEGFAAEALDGDLRHSGERVLRSDDADQLIAEDDRGFHLGVVGAEADHAHFDGVGEDIIGNAAGERALDGDLDARVLAAEGVQQRQQVEAGVLVGGQVELAGVQRAQVDQGGARVRPQVEHLLRVVAENLAGVGEDAVAGGALEQRLTEFSLQLGDDLADRRLGAVQARGGAGEAALFGDGEEGFELEEVHGAPVGVAFRAGEA